MAAPKEIVPLLVVKTPQPVPDLAVVGANEKAKQLAVDKSLEDVKVVKDNNDTAIQEKLPYPISVFFLISCEFCERFNYYGMRTVLVFYLSHRLGYTDDAATILFHMSAMFSFMLCILGAIIADSWLGKFKTILYLSMVYICGCTLLTLGAIGPLQLPANTFTIMGLFFISVGAGGIKPCVASFGGDQFTVPQQLKQLTGFFSLFYFSINAGSFLSVSVTPILREDVHCFGELSCYPLAFGVPAVLMIIAILIFLLGSRLYIIKPAAGNIVVNVSRTIWTAVKTKWQQRHLKSRAHWLDYAAEQHEPQMITDVKIILRVLCLYLPLPLFYALLDQQGSRWTFQAARMNGDVGVWRIKPDQFHIVNPLLILVLIALKDVLINPVLKFLHLSRPLQKISLGGILAGVAFICSGLLELQMEQNYPVLPYVNNIQLRIFNTENCTYEFSSNLYNNSVKLLPYSVYTDKNLHVPSVYDLTYTLSSTDGSCPLFEAGRQQLTHKHAWSLILNARNTSSSSFWTSDFVNKPRDTYPQVRSIANTKQTSSIRWQSSKEQFIHPANETKLMRMAARNYLVYIDDIAVKGYELRQGGVYTLLINELQPGSYYTKLVEVTAPNELSMLWQLPQYVFIILAELLVSVTGLEFSYAQAPPSMKAVLQACWLLTMGFGNVIVVVIAKLKIFERQSYEFFFYAVLVFIDMLIFMWIAHKYKPNVETEEREDVVSSKKNLEKSAKYLE
ncbi:peptide transporter family 1 [Drosophila busckii]|uniref:peptide transporter family 1 n=1 Tax=Drosophila busckii TaxID=30019 RepID=UPI001432ECAB|nr:peptide transporter family 1 [Drosophila busckii]